MKVIKDIAVAVQPTSEQFRDALLNTARRFQEMGLEVTINNPHLLNDGDKYVAVVEGRAEEVNDDPPFDINPVSTVPNRRI